MSLMRLAFRTCATQALMGQTSIPDVCDSAINAFNLDQGKIGTDRQKPFVAVYTGNGKIEGGAINGKSLNQNGLTELLIETGIATAMATTGDDGVAQILEIPVTDPALEMLLDLAGAEISSALVSPDNEWAQLFQMMIDELIKVERNGARNAEDGARVAGQQIIIHVNLIEDPLRGTSRPEGHVIDQFIALCATADEGSHARLVGEKIAEALVGNTIGQVEYYQIAFGMTRGAAVAVLGDSQGIEDEISGFVGPHVDLAPDGEHIVEPDEGQ